MKDLIKRSILKTLREFNLLGVIPTLEDLYYSLDTSEFKTSVKRPIFDELLEDLLHSDEIGISSTEGIFFVYIDKSSIPENVVEYRRAYKKRISALNKRLEKIQKLPYVLNISNLNLIPLLNSGQTQFYVFAKNNSGSLISFILKMLLIDKHDQLKYIKVVEYNDIKNIFPERNAQSAYKLANLHPIVNKDNFFENLIYANKWVFEILGNFPVSKVSLNYRGTNKKSNFDSGFITRIINKIF
jgi:hypothetical protein